MSEELVNYRKKPATVRAAQWTGDVSDLPGMLVTLRGVDGSLQIQADFKADGVSLTLVSFLDRSTVNPTDYVVVSSENPGIIETYDKDTFEEIYEIADPTEVGNVPE